MVKQTVIPFQEKSLEVFVDEDLSDKAPITERSFDMYCTKL